MEPRSYLGGRIRLYPGDCRESLRHIPDNSVDAAVMDPPYALESIRKRFGGPDAAPAQEGSDGAFRRASRGFMGKQWDTGEVAFDPTFWSEVLRVLKPGGYLVAFSGTRTYHRMASAIDDAGFEVRDSILDMMASDSAVGRFLETLSPTQAEAFFRCVEDSQLGGMLGWVYGTGFPKSHSVPKAIDTHFFHGWLDANPEIRVRYQRLTAWAVDRDRRKVSKGLRGRIERAFRRRGGFLGEFKGTEALSNDMRNSALLLAGKGERREGYERELYGHGTPDAAAWEGWGTALKPAWEPIVMARKPLGEETVAANVLAHGTGAVNVGACQIDGQPRDFWNATERHGGQMGGGGKSSGTRGYVPGNPSGRFPANLIHDGSPEVVAMFPDDGPRPARQIKSAAHASVANGANKDRLFDAPACSGGSAARFFYSAKADGDDRLGSKHPTVKPVDLMRWLVRLVCRKGGTVLDTFAGTGTTGEAAYWEGCNAILCEREDEYIADIENRIGLILAGPDEKKRARTEPAPAEELPLFGGETVAMVEAINGGGKATGVGSMATSPKMPPPRKSASQPAKRANHA